MTSLVLLLAASAGSVTVPSRETAAVILSSDPVARRSQEQWGYSAAIRVGNLVFVSGVVAAVREGEIGPERAYERAFEEIGWRLVHVGSSWGDVVDIISFHTDVATQLKAMVAVKSRYVRAPFPAWTAVGVSRLIPNSGITEIRVIAYRPARKGH